MISSEFENLVTLIEENKPTVVWITFQSKEEIEASAKLFIERAVVRHQLAAKFAEAAGKFGFLTPWNEGGENTFKKAVIDEIQSQLDQVVEGSAGSLMTLDEAIGLTKLFGELYKSSLIPFECVRKYFEAFEAEKDENLTSYRCFYCLIGIVKEKLLEENDKMFSISMKKIVEKIERAEKYPTDPPTSSSDVKINPENFSMNFPALEYLEYFQVKSKNSPTKSIFEVKNSPENFKNLVEKLTTKNSKEVAMEIDKIFSQKASTKQLKSFLAILTTKALSHCDLIEVLIEIGQKTFNRDEEYRKCINEVMILKLTELLDENDVRKRSENFMEFLRKMIEFSLSSINDLSAILKTILIYASANSCLAFFMSAQLLKVVRETKGEEKMKALMNAYRYKLFQVATKENRGKVVEEGKEEVLAIMDDFLKELQMEDDEEASGLSQVEATNFPSTSSKFDLILATIKSLNSFNVEECVEKLSFLELSNLSEIDYFIDILVRDAIKTSWHLPNVKNYAKFTAIYLNLPLKSSGWQDLKSHLAKHCKQMMINFSNPAFNETQHEEIFCFIKFICELFNLEVFDHELVNFCLGILIAQEKKCNCSVFCLSIITKSIEKSKRSERIVFRCFKFFEHAVKGIGSSYRFNIYKELIELINVEWKGFSELWEVSDEEKELKLAVKAKTGAIIKYSSEALKLNLKSENFNSFEEKLRQIREFEEAQEASNQSFLDEKLSQILDVEASIKTQEASTSNLENQSFIDENLGQNKTTKKAQKTSKPVQEPARILPQKSTFIPIVLDQTRPLTNEDFIALKSCLKTSSDVKNFITKLTYRFSKTLDFIRLFKELDDITFSDGTSAEVSFRQLLIETIMTQFAVTNSKQYLSETSLISFANLLLMVGELYRADVLPDDDLCVWLIHKHIKKVPVESLASFSSLISLKIHAKAEMKLVLLLQNLENLIHEATLKVCEDMNDDLAELYDLLRMAEV